MNDNIESIKSKIAKLLAKAERTDNDHERDAFNAQAERMMLRLGIERAELEAAGEVKAEEIVEESRVWSGNYAIVMVPFMSGIGRAFGNMAFLQSMNHNGMRRTSFVIGHKSEVEEFLALVDSLATQVMAALKRWQKEVREERRYYTDMEKYTGNRSFIEAFGYTVASRLRKERREEEAEATPGAALVLASKMDKVTSWRDQKYTNLRMVRTGARTYDGGAAAAGHVAGLQASLGEKGIGGTRGALQ